MNCCRRYWAYGSLAGGAALLVWTLYRSHRAGKCCFATCCKKDSNVYETQRSVNEYLLMHFGKDDVLMPWPFGPKEALHFPKRVAELCFQYKPSASKLSVIDIGCAVGCLSFHLTSQFDDVLGIDYSQAFVDAANKLKTQGKLDYEVLEEGEIYSTHTAEVDGSLDRSRTRFERGDACNLRSDIGTFDCVVAANLICRLKEPRKFFDRMKTLVVDNGILVITTPYTFMEQFTPKENWIGGYLDSDDRPVRAADAIIELLSPDFTLETSENLPFLIRETARKNQWTVAHAMVWRRKSQ